MKFKSIFLLFNAIILISLSIILFLPLFLLDWEYARLFWASNWYVGIVFIGFFAGINVYFVRFWKAYELLEREDWPQLQRFLHSELFDRRRFRSQYVRLSIHNAIVLSQPDEILELEKLLREGSPRLHARFSLLLGLPYVLRNEHAAMEHYYGSVLNVASGRQRVWVSWMYAFSLYLQKRLDDARQEFDRVRQNSRDPMIKVMTLYMYESCVQQDADALQELQQQRQALQQRLPQSKMIARIERNRDNLMVLVLDQFIRDAVAWVYAEQAGEGQ